MKQSRIDFPLLQSDKERLKKQAVDQDISLAAYVRKQLGCQPLRSVGNPNFKAKKEKNDERS